MVSDPNTVRLALRQIEQRIATAARNAGRDPGTVTLVAVSKTHPAEAILDAIAAGQSSFGENRVQEATEKFAPIMQRFPATRLHLIGPLQTNKARDAVRIATVIESLDRPRLLRAIADAAHREGRCPRLLVQVNVGDEPQKAGVSRTDADRFIDACQAEFTTELCGLMAIPPAGVDPLPHFLWLAACAQRHGLATLSMGMSGDFEIAVGAGATHVRVGSAIFGTRVPGAKTVAEDKLAPDVPAMRTES